MDEIRIEDLEVTRDTLNKLRDIYYEANQDNKARHCIFLETDISNIIKEARKL